MIRIDYLAYIRFPSERAHAVQVAYMCDAFGALGHGVRLITTSRRANVTKSFSEYFGIEQTFTHEMLSIPEWAVRHGLLTKAWQMYFALRAAFLVRRSESDIVYSRDEWVLFFVRLFSKKRIHVWESHEAKWNYAAKKLFAASVPCVCISEGVQEFYLEKGVDPKLLVVAHDAIHASFLESVGSKEEARSELGIETTLPVLLYIGGLNTWKGVDVVLKASDKLKDVVQTAIIGGSESEIEKLETQYPNVQFLGYQPYAKLALNQQAADILVNPSTKTNNLSFLFTSPMKLFSYMASKIPIVAADTPSSKHVLGDSAFYYESDDVDSLVSTVKSVIDDREGVCARTEAAYKRVSSQTWDIRAKRILAHVSGEGE